MVLFVLACALARATLGLRLARIRGRAQRTEVVKLAEGDTLTLTIYEEGDF